MGKKNKRIDYSFVPLPREVFKGQEFASLNTSAVKLLIDLLVQFNGRNNGDFTLAWKIMSKKGWRSKATLERAKKELLKKGFVEETRKGGRNCCSLFAVTWLEIDCDRSKLDARKSYKASHAWHNKNGATKTGSKCYQNEVNNGNKAKK